MSLHGKLDVDVYHLHRPDDGPRPHGARVRFGRGARDGRHRGARPVGTGRGTVFCRTLPECRSGAPPRRRAARASHRVRRAVTALPAGRSPGLVRGAARATRSSIRREPAGRRRRSAPLRRRDQRGACSWWPARSVGRRGCRCAGQGRRRHRAARGAHLRRPHAAERRPPGRAAPAIIDWIGAGRGPRIWPLASLLRRRTHLTSQSSRLSGSSSRPSSRSLDRTASSRSPPGRGVGDRARTIWAWMV